MTDQAYSCLIESSELSEIRFVHDYVQLVFHPHTLSLYAPIQVLIGGRALSKHEAGFYDSICSLVGKRLSHVDRQESDHLMLSFFGSTAVVVSLRSKDASGPEAAELFTPGGGIIVERYEEEPSNLQFDTEAQRRST